MQKLLNLSIFCVFYTYLGILPIAYCLLPIAYAWLDAFGGLDAYCRNAYCLRMHTASECIRRQYAIKAECNQARMQSISLSPIAYCLLPIP